MLKTWSGRTSSRACHAPRTYGSRRKRADLCAILRTSWCLEGCSRARRAVLWWQKSSGSLFRRTTVCAQGYQYASLTSIYLIYSFCHSTGPIRRNLYSVTLQVILTNEEFPLVGPCGIFEHNHPQLMAVTFDRHIQEVEAHDINLTISIGTMRERGT